MRSCVLRLIGRSVAWASLRRAGNRGRAALPGHMELASGPVSWHNEAHTIVSLALCADLVLAQLLLARALCGKAGLP